MTRVLLIGATGVFGSLLARSLAREPGVALSLAGRTARTLNALAAELDGAAIAVLDRERITAESLAGFDVVIDAAGPFQHSHSAVIEAAIAARCHYIDIADGRDFVIGVGRFDDAARAAGVAVLSGASSTPALSHAAIDRMTGGWRSIAAIRAVLRPGSSVRGMSLVRAVLSYLGRPVRVFRDGGWTTARGWGQTRRAEIPGLATGAASLCETPDLDLFAERYRPAVAAEFLTSLEVPLMHWGLAALGLLVRAGLAPRLERHAGALRILAAIGALLGSNRGGMTVEVSGSDGEGETAFARWWLWAPPGAGPNVPTFAALALVRRIRDGHPPEAGARPCVGVLDLDDFAADFARFGMESGVDIFPPQPPLFARALRTAFPTLPAVNRRIHAPGPALVLHGEADIDGAETSAGRLAARLFGFPTEGKAVPLRAVIEATPAGTERWARVFPGRVLRSTMDNPDAATRSVEERFGLVRFRLRLDPREDGLDMVLRSARIGPLPLPRFLLPRIAAAERIDGERHLFDVAIGLPLLGRLVRYRGWLH
ncbi:MAG: DUF4166 domain-containing protein [Sphingomonadales bacterium]